MKEDLQSILTEIIPFGPLTEGDTKFIAPISEEEIWEAMKSAKEKATGRDGIPLRLWKKAKQVCIPVLTVVFSHILLLCSWPIECTESIALLLYKRGSSKEFSNYRMIEISPTVRNIFCKIVGSRLRKWLEEFGKSIDEQSGHRKEGGAIEQVFI
jgi:hypothetical protein